MDISTEMLVVPKAFHYNLQENLLMLKILLAQFAIGSMEICFADRIVF